MFHTNGPMHYSNSPEGPPRTREENSDQCQCDPLGQMLKYPPPRDESCSTSGNEFGRVNRDVSLYDNAPMNSGCLSQDPWPEDSSAPYPIDPIGPAPGASDFTSVDAFTPQRPLCPGPSSAVLCTGATPPAYTSQEPVLRVETSFTQDHCPEVSPRQYRGLERVSQDSQAGSIQDEADYPSHHGVDSSLPSGASMIGNLDPEPRVYPMSYQSAVTFNNPWLIGSVTDEEFQPPHWKDKQIYDGTLPFSTPASLSSIQRPPFKHRIKSAPANLLVTPALEGSMPAPSLQDSSASTLDKGDPPSTKRKRTASVSPDSQAIQSGKRKKRGPYTPEKRADIAYKRKYHLVCQECRDAKRKVFKRTSFYINGVRITNDPTVHVCNKVSS